MTNIKPEKFLDDYTIKARVIPALIVITPYLQILPNSSTSIIQFINHLILNGIFLFIISNIVRGFGEKKERKLFKEWGGLPSTIILRHRDNTVSAILKKRYHDILAKKITIKFPLAEEEQTSPEKSDDIYSTSVKWLLEQTRDKSRFYLLSQENISYGYWRNVWALKPIGIIVTIFSLLLCIPNTLVKINAQTFDENALIPPIMCLGILWFWFFIVTKEQVKEAAYVYAKTLLAQCDAI